MWDFPGGREGGLRYFVLGLGAGSGADLVPPPDADELIAYGPLLSDDGGSWLGTAALVRAAGPEQARAILTAGAYAEIEVQVEHRDLIPLHVSQLQATAAERPEIRTAVADARALDLPAASVDAVLLFGPLYHLADPADRAAVLGEAVRILRPGGTLFAAAISRWATRIDGILGKQTYVKHPVVLELIDQAERTGVVRPVHELAFTAYTHRPDDLRAELERAGLEAIDLACVEGPASLLPDLDARLADPLDRAVILDAARRWKACPS